MLPVLKQEVCVLQKSRKLDLFDNCLNYNPHKRQEISFITKDLDLIYELKQEGWIKKNVSEGIKLKAPEVWLVDLTDPYKYDMFKSKLLLLDYYNFLIERIEDKSINYIIEKILILNNIKDLKFKVIRGESISYEIRVAGSDNRIYILRELLLDYFLTNTNNKYMIGSNLCLEHKMKNSFFTKVISKYNSEHICEKDKLKNIEIKKLKIPIEKYDYILLIPTSCFKYSGLLKDVDPKKIVFVRVHASNNFEIEETINFPIELNNKTCLIIDVGYSGETLRFMKNYLNTFGANVETLALFPKSQLALKNSDYCVILDKLFLSKKLLNLSIEKIYYKIGREKNEY